MSIENPEPIKEVKPEATEKSSKATIITAIIAVVAFVIVAIFIFLPKNAQPTEDTTAPPVVNTNGPKNLPFDSITVVGNGTTEINDQFIEADATFTATPFAPRADGKTTVTVYFDPQCPACGAFEKTNSDTLDQLLKDNTIALDLHPIAFLDSKSTTDYSTRSVNALACVANYNPNSFYDYFKALYSNQPAEGSAGLSDEKLIELAKVVEATDVADCINDQEFRPWSIQATERAINGPLMNTSEAAVTGTPFILINGVLYTGSITDANEFKEAVQEAKSV